MATPTEAAVSSQAQTRITYHEPSFPDLATITSFLYLVQVCRNLADWAFGAGLLGEIAVGVVYGPVANIMLPEWEETFIVVGYLGLVLIVFEGGLTIHPEVFIPTLPTAIVSALVGILLPIALTFGLFHAFGYPTLWAFSAGSALASTSLGTTMFCLKTQSEKQGRDLSATLVGAILQGAALLDDIVALVLLTVITALGEGDGSNNGLGWTIGQPIVASIGMAVVGPLFTFYVARPLFRRSLLESWVEKGGRNAQLLIGVAVLCAHLAIAYYIHTTMLLGAFLAGVFLFALPSPSSSVNFAKTYEHLVEPVHKYILAPLFFSSIGFTIPFLELWTGQVVWRGIVYSILMTLAKVAVGLSIVFIDLVTKPYANVSVASSAAVGSPREHSATSSSTTVPIPVSSSTDVEQPDGDYDVSVKAANVAEQAGTTGKTSTAGAMARFEMLQTETLPAAAFLGFALVARGEIGVLILQVAYNAAPPGSTTSTEENGGSRVLGTEAYLVAIWATALCTIIGPVVFSAVVKRYGRAIYQGRWGKLRKGEEI